MDISINEQNRQHIRHMLASGKYASPDEVIDTALKLLDERDTRLEKLRRQIWRELGVENEAAVPDSAVMEIYTPERIAEFLLNNAVDREDYVRAREEVERLHLDPDQVLHERPPV